MSKWGPVAGLMAVGLVALGLAGWALAPKPVEDSSFDVAHAPIETTVAGQERAAFIGDSYSHGTGASASENRWTTLVSKSKGWVEQNLALGGTGYVKTAGINGCGLEFCDNYDGVVLSTPELSVDTFFVAGGQNDFALWRTDSAAVTAAIDKTYDDLRAQYPGATIIAVGPSTVGEVGTTAIAFDSAVQNAAARVGATYVSLIDPNVIAPDMITEDGGHVQDAGHRAIADRVLATIE